MSASARGVLALVAACVIWGLSPLYYKLLVHVPPLDVLAHRTLWSCVFFTLVLMAQRRLRALAATMASPAAGLATLAGALMITANWFLFIFSVQANRVTESSLGYYIYPLVAVVFGVLFFQERLRLVQGCAVALAALAVALLTLGQGTLPWISLVLATTFGFYGVIKKRSKLGPVVTVTAEVMVLAPPALAYLIWAHGDGSDWPDAGTLILLMAAGPVTALPLMLFSYASIRVSMATAGLVQYLNPTLQFLCAVVIFSEPFGWAQALAFGLIWTALALYSLASWRQDRAARRVARAASTSPAKVTKSDRLPSAKP